MRRRQVLRWTAAPLLWWGNRCARAQANTADVLVIGAGMAGLKAAQDLRAAGYDVIVLEARNREGGRVRTDFSSALPFDEGASWIHGPRGNPITALAAAAGAETFLTDEESTAIFDQDGSRYADATLLSVEADYEALLDEIRASEAATVAAAITDLEPELLRDRLWQYILSAYLEFATSGSLDMLSAQHFDDDEVFPGADVIVTNGYERLASYLAHDLDLRLNTAVQAILYDETGVEVVTNQGRFEADAVVVTVPLGVLKQGRLRFEPGLPTRHQTAIQRLGMGNVNKFLLTWAAPFWDEDLQYIGYTPAALGKFNYFVNTLTFSDVPALMTFALGDYATPSEALSDAAAIEAIMSHLRAIYGMDIPQPTRLQRTRWRQDSYSLGAYSFAQAGSSWADFEAFAEPIDDVLFWAGEHTTGDYRGTVHGAYLSGARAAAQIEALA